MKPQRIQLSRKRGFNLQAHSQAINGLPAVKVDRSTRWGNPFLHGQMGRKKAVSLFRRLLNRRLTKRDRDALRINDLEWLAFSVFACTTVRDAREKLRGKNLACWCPPDQPCHADVLLEIANS